MKRAIELCSGAGGLTEGLARAGYEIVCTVDNDPDILKLRPLDKKHVLSDIANFNFSDCIDLLVAGFPCQPFSSSGHRSGFSHPSGSVFDNFLKIIDSIRPPGILLENVLGLLSNKCGHTFWSILQEISERGYTVEWFTIEALSLGIPQDRSRVFIAATHTQSLGNLPKSARNIGLLKELTFSTRSEIGYKPKRIHAPKNGRLINDTCVQTPDLIPKNEYIRPPHIGDIIAPGIRNRHELRSVRYWAHTGKTKAYFKNTPIAHAVGTSIGAAPLFGLRRVPTTEEQNYIKTISSWSRVEPDGSGFVFRLNPELAVSLFGEDANFLSHHFRQSTLSNSAKYRLLGNMVVPRVGSYAAELILKRLNSESILRN